MAAGGYPGSYEKGKLISGLEEVGEADDLVVFHAGTAEKQGRARDLRRPRPRRDGARRHGGGGARPGVRGCETIRWEGARYRKDIASRAIGR
jgi:phosphoribosylamine--glycine ligase